MCGIAGQVRGDGSPVGRGRVEGMCERIVHRGPDSRGVHREGEVGLGIQRLRVIDLATGDQPIYNEDRSVVVVLNGEIYNYRELRERLAARGHRFATEGDTEVIVHLYEERGDDLVEELRGMFAFALWDAKSRRLLIGRDRVGKKPLIYAEQEGGLIFASEMAALLAGASRPPRIDLGAIDSYLAFGYVPHPGSAFAGVRKLPPGSTLSWSAEAGVDVRRYWRLDYEPKQDLADAELGEAIRERLRECVRSRLVSDVPLGAFLSGGLDSGAVVAAMAMESAETVKTFSVGFEDERHSELPLARLVAERYGTDHREFILEPSALAVLPAIARHHGEPFADTSAVPSFQIAAVAAEHVTVALNGDGGDENFAGYHRYQAEARVARLDLLPGAVRRGLAGLAARHPERGDPMRLLNRARRLAALSGMDALGRHQRQMSIFAPAARGSIYSPEMRAALGTGPGLGPAWLEGTALEPLDRLLELDFETYLPDDLCLKVDVATMAHSLESRSPFLDPALLEFTARLPVERKMRRGVRKVALREALRPWLPEEVLSGQKRGFGIPSAGDWLRGELREFCEDLVLGERALGRGYFRPDAVRRLVAEHNVGDGDHGPRLWALMMLELWHREIVDAGPAAA
jgi:asparagine synthase (glutamine-hydrolysing)